MIKTPDRESSAKTMTPHDLGARVDGDHAGALRGEGERVGAKIDAAYRKLADKLRGKADKAEAAMAKKKGEAKRAMLRRRFELYADAAQQIEALSAERGGPRSDSD